GRTKSPPLIVSFEPSGYLIVALPLSSTVTSVPFGRSEFTLPTSSVTLSLSPSVKCSGSFTGTLSSGFFGPFVSYLSASFSGRTKSPPLIVSFEPSGYLIVTLPLSSTVTSVPFGRSEFTLPTSSVTLSLSPSVKCSGSFTGTLSSGFFGPFESYLSASFSGRTKSPPLIVSFEPSGYLIVALPLSSTVTSVPFGRSEFTLPTSSVTLSLSPSVKCSGSFTGTLSSGFFGPFGSYL